MENNSNKKIWFEYRKQYLAKTGYWQPICWQGWAVHIGLPLILVLIFLYIGVDFNSLEKENILKMIVVFIVFVPIWVYIYYTKGEKIKWWRIRGGKTIEEWNKSNEFENKE